MSTRGAIDSLRVFASCSQLVQFRLCRIIARTGGALITEFKSQPGGNWRETVYLWPSGRAGEVEMVGHILNQITFVD